MVCPDRKNAEFVFVHDSIICAKRKQIATKDKFSTCFKIEQQPT